MSYLRQILKAKLNKKKLPAITELVREYPRWKTYLSSRDALHNGIPWITFWAMDYLDQHLNNTMKVFEYGGGGSTVFFASRVKELVTIEHDREWFDGLNKVMESNKQIKWSGFLVGPEHASEIQNSDIADPDNYLSEDVNFTGKTFKKYASSIDVYPDEYFDIVLVDGRARPSCLKHSLNKVKKDGFLILDNSDRAYYLERMGTKLKNFKLISEHYGPTPYVPWFTQTNIWKRSL